MIVHRTRGLRHDAPVTLTPQSRSCRAGTMTAEAISPWRRNPRQTRIGLQRLRPWDSAGGAACAVPARLSRVFVLLAPPRWRCSRILGFAYLGGRENCGGYGGSYPPQPAVESYALETSSRRDVAALIRGASGAKEVVLRGARLGRAHRLVTYAHVRRACRYLKTSSFMNVSASRAGREGFAHTAAAGQILVHFFLSSWPWAFRKWGLLRATAGAAIGRHAFRGLARGHKEPAFPTNVTVLRVLPRTARRRRARSRRC